jgi:hypothetical protein
MDYVVERKKDNKGAFYVIRERLSKNAILRSNYFADNELVNFEKELSEISFMVSGWRHFVKSKLKDGDSLVFVGSPIEKYIQETIVKSISEFRNKNARILVLFPGKDGRVILNKSQLVAQKYGWEYIGNGFKIQKTGFPGFSIVRSVSDLIEAVNEMSKNNEKFQITVFK